MDIDTLNKFCQDKNIPCPKFEKSTLKGYYRCSIYYEGKEYYSESCYTDAIDKCAYYILTQLTIAGKMTRKKQVLFKIDSDIKEFFNVV
jgi:hypothetical protein